MLTCRFPFPAQLNAVVRVLQGFSRDIILIWKSDGFSLMPGEKDLFGSTLKVKVEIPSSSFNSYRTDDEIVVLKIANTDFQDVLDRCHNEELVIFEIDESILRVRFVNRDNQLEARLGINKFCEEAMSRRPLYGLQSLRGIIDPSSLKMALDRFPRQIFLDINPKGVTASNTCSPTGDKVDVHGVSVGPSAYYHFSSNALSSLIELFNEGIFVYENEDSPLICCATIVPGSLLFHGEDITSDTQGSGSCSGSGPLPVGLALVGQKVYTIAKPEDVIQTVAATHPGNHGGPHVYSSATRKTVIYSNSGASSSVGCSMQDYTGGDFVSKDTQPYLGIKYSLDQCVEQLGINGVLFVDVVPNGPAHKAGLQPSKYDYVYGILAWGDIIISVNGEKVSDVAYLSRIICQCRVGEKVMVEVQRGDHKEHIPIVLEPKPDRTNA